MSKLTYTRQLDKLIIGLLEDRYPILIQSNSKLFFEQKKNNGIYYAPIYDGKTREVYSHYARGIIRVRRNSKGEYHLIYKNPDVKYEVLGNNYQNSTEQVKIAYFISRSTTKEKIIKQIDTKDRLELWLQHKDYSYRIASCFLNGDKLLKQESDKKIITKSVFDIIYTIYQLHSELYEIIDRKWLRIANQFRQDKKFLFDSSFELFKDIICKIIDNEYNKFLLPQIPLRAKDKFNIYKLSQEVLSSIASDDLTPIQKQKLKREIQKLHILTAPKLSDNYWYRKTLDFLISENQKDCDIKYFFERRKNLTSKLFETMKSRKFPKPPNCMMIDGVIDEGSNWQSRNGQVNPARKPNKT